MWRALCQHSPDVPTSIFHSPLGAELSPGRRENQIAKIQPPPVSQAAARSLLRAQSPQLPCRPRPSPQPVRRPAPPGCVCAGARVSWLYPRLPGPRRWVAFSLSLGLHCLGCKMRKLGHMVSVSPLGSDAQQVPCLGGVSWAGPWVGAWKRCRMSG